MLHAVKSVMLPEKIPETPVSVLRIFSLGAVEIVNQQIPQIFPNKKGTLAGYTMVFE